MKTSRCFNILLGIILGGTLNTAAAHSFNLVFIAPINEIAAQSALNGFLLATREQDSHAFEESDGHLGGLDSYVFKVDSAAGPDQLTATIRESAPLFAVGSGIDSSISEVLESGNVVLVDPVASKFWESAKSDPGRPTLMNGGSFSGAFEREYGYAPDSEAVRGYLAARIIATIVRDASGPARFSAEKLKPAVEQAMRSPPW